MKRAVPETGHAVATFRGNTGWLRIDPTFAPLEGNARLERLGAQ